MTWNSKPKPAGLQRARAYNRVHVRARARCMANRLWRIGIWQTGSWGQSTMANQHMAKRHMAKWRIPLKIVSTVKKMKGKGFSLFLFHWNIILSIKYSTVSGYCNRHLRHHWMVGWMFILKIDIINRVF